MIQGAVGEGAGVEFVAFLRIWSEMVSPDLILTAPDTAAIPTEPSALYAVSTAIAMRVAERIDDALLPLSRTALRCRPQRVCGGQHEDRPRSRAQAQQHPRLRESHVRPLGPTDGRGLIRPTLPFYSILNPLLEHHTMNTTSLSERAMLASLNIRRWQAALDR